MENNNEISDIPSFEDFYEEVSINQINDAPEAYDTITGGLSQESVQKLTEDLLNPIPPSDNESL